MLRKARRRTPRSGVCWSAQPVTDGISLQSSGPRETTIAVATITFDTLKFTKRLKEAGFTEAQAEAVADSFLQATGEAEVATKRDLERVEAKIERLETKLTGELTLVKWMLSIVLGGIVALLLKAFFPS